MNCYNNNMKTNIIDVLSVFPSVSGAAVRSFFVLIISLMIITSTFASAAASEISDSGSSSDGSVSDSSQNTGSPNDPASGNPEPGSDLADENPDLSDTSSDSSSEDESENEADDPASDDEKEDTDPGETRDSDTDPEINIHELTSFKNAEPFSTDEAYMTGLFTGAAVYTYPIRTPDGIAGLRPEVSLIYNSQSAGGVYGWLGDGWSMNDFYILRDVYYTPENTSDDRFRLYFNGQSYDLIYNATDGRYHTETENYMNIRKVTGSNENTYGEYWKVLTKNGTEYRFGYTADSELENSVTGRNYVTKWKLDRIRDTSGNSIICNYIENPGSAGGETGTSYLKNITYNNGLTVIEFNRTSKPVTFSGYHDGSLVIEKSLLSDITIKVNNAVSSKYHITYNTSENHVFLESVQYYGAGGTSSLPATSFSYGTTNVSFDENVSVPLPNADFPYSGDDCCIEDMNGDALQDIVLFLPSGNSSSGIWINNGSGYVRQKYNVWNMPTDFDRLRIADIDGNGLPDILYSYYLNQEFKQVWINNGSAFTLDSSITLPEYFIYDGTDRGVRIGDINGDGLQDILKSKKNVGKSVWINNGTGFENSSEWDIPAWFYSQ
ncbi:VCBS repeat-containing protein, partial [Methanosarcinaceae archaeon]|nr:VCBS repeat-containing protein [Methanosarcinaceae archaeon]